MPGKLQNYVGWTRRLRRCLQVHATCCHGSAPWIRWAALLSMVDRWRGSVCTQGSRTCCSGLPTWVPFHWPQTWLRCCLSAIYFEPPVDPGMQIFAVDWSWSAVRIFRRELIERDCSVHGGLPRSWCNRYGRWRVVTRAMGGGAARLPPALILHRVERETPVTRAAALRLQGCSLHSPTLTASRDVVRAQTVPDTPLRMVAVPTLPMSRTLGSRSLSSRSISMIVNVTPGFSSLRLSHEARSRNICPTDWNVAILWSGIRASRRCSPDGSFDLMPSRWRRSPLQDVPVEAARAAMLQGVRELGIEVLPWTRDARDLQARMEFVRVLEEGDRARKTSPRVATSSEDALAANGESGAADGGGGAGSRHAAVIRGAISEHGAASGDALAAGAAWPAVSDAVLAATADVWLAPWLDGVTRRDHLARLSLTEILRALLPWEKQRRLDELAPTHLQVPSGSNIRIDYLDESAPAVSVKLQEVFGLDATPRIGAGRVPITFKLLSPAQRPVQVTRDLASFWRGSYADVRKDMRGRYPKHYWPENPLEAEATRGARRRKPQ